MTADPRSVVIHALELVAFRGPEAVDLSVRCSKGTYVRALARDLGRALGPGAHVTALRRTRSGPFALADAQPLDEVVAALSAGEGPDCAPSLWRLRSAISSAVSSAKTWPRTCVSAGVSPGISRISDACACSTARGSS